MESSPRSMSCSKLRLSPEACATQHTSSSLPLSLGEDWKMKNEDLTTFEEPVTVDQKDCHTLVQNCGPDCMITQRIVDRLLARMLQLENERSELLAANRSWAVQFQMMQDKNEERTKKLEADLRLARRDGDRSPTRGANEEVNESKLKDQLNLLTHQAEVYREDFMEERKARVRAHAQMEALRNELKRERKSRVKLSSIVNQSRVCEETPQTLG
ncbi:uncharacterized protein LOC143445164 [Clavelina lepadiformis]|uniref:uncharacterized protein LOC143445164 n=1 Tax=Clavelina lepadiformis TaxID=159417 RepID=UPI0040427A95